MNPLAGLTPSQREVVTADHPILCVLAGAGAGKTRVLTLRVLRRALDGEAHPSHVLVCTFSRKAADELSDRLWSAGIGSEVHAGTFHRTAWRLIRQHAADRGRTVPTLLADRRPVMAEVLTSGDAPTPRRRATAGKGRPSRPYAETARLEGEIGWAKSRLVAPAAYVEAAQRAGRRPSGGLERMAELYAQYETVRQRRGMVDMDDLLWLAADLLEDDRWGEAVRWRYRHLYVDEMQDLNEAQFRLLQLLAGPDPDLFVVGDPNQSVYGWNGSDPGLIDRIPDVFPGTRVLRLDANHRSSPQIVRAAATVLAAAPARTEGSERPDPRRPRRPVPVDQLPLGPGTAASAAPEAPRIGRDGPVPRVVRLDDDPAEAAWIAHQAWLAHRPGRLWSHIAVLARTNAQLSRLADALRTERVPHRVAGAELAPASDLWSSLNQNDESDEDDGGHPVEAEDTDVVVLSTFHRAKGLEWPVVFVAGLSDGLVPIAGARSGPAREEERRLLYVALTRAERELTCTWAERATGADAASSPRRPSPWLPAIESAVAAMAAQEAGADPAQAAHHLAAIRQRLDTADS